MKKADAVAYFGGKSKLAHALGIAPASVSQWGEDIPKLRAFQIELLTQGDLKAVASKPLPLPDQPPRTLAEER